MLEDLKNLSDNFVFCVLGTIGAVVVYKSEKYFKMQIPKLLLREFIRPVVGPM